MLIADTRSAARSSYTLDKNAFLAFLVDTNGPQKGSSSATRNSPSQVRFAIWERFKCRDYIMSVQQDISGDVVLQLFYRLFSVVAHVK